MKSSLRFWARRQPRLVPLLVLVMGVAVTLLATAIVQHNISTRQDERFAEQAARTEAAIEDRLDNYLALLEAGVGLFAAREGAVDRAAFARFARHLRPGERYPGIQGLGYTALLAPDGDEALVRRMEAEGHAGFRPWPEGMRDTRHAILYLEPEDARNRAAIGYDMYSEPVRRAAMDAARDSGRAAATGPVRLVQEIDANDQPGFLIYAPVYAGGARPDSVDERRRLLTGFVYGPFRADDLFHGIFGDEAKARMRFAIHDGAPAEGRLLHFSPGYEPARGPALVRSIAIGGREWTLGLQPSPDLWTEAEAYAAPVMLAGGLIATLLLALVTLLQSRAWREAEDEVSEREAAEQALRAANAQLEAVAAEQEAVLSQLAEGVIFADTDGRIGFVNDAAAQMHGVSVLGVAPSEYPSAYSLLTEAGEPYPAEELPLSRAVLRGEEVVDARWRIRRPDGSEVRAIGTARPVMAGGRRLGAVITIRDETARIDAERALRGMNETLERRVAEALAEQQRAEESLRQAQKMEAIGQLTGGIAHDFNNMLAVIVGSLDMARRRLEDREPRVGALIANAQEGAHRAATLTQRLLAFSRRQPLSPEAIDANALIAGMSELLRRTIGEEIRVRLEPAEELWPIFADRNQLENVILNLAVNARDAMPDGGRLVIRTENAEIDPERAKRKELPPGDYVRIEVEDSGTGMAPETVQRAFEPFFTTKPVGKGTGLGLSQVYGFLRQTGGQVRILSEEGRGTSISLFLPRHAGAPAAVASRAVPDPAEAPRARDGETVLVVEDEPQVRAMSVSALKGLGYAVLSAGDPHAALTLVEEDGRIDLLFTDVVMPGMNGRDLADAARARRPGLKVLFTTGYARDGIVREGNVEQGVEMIAKPFALSDLARRLRAMLDGLPPR